MVISKSFYAHTKMKKDEDQSSQESQSKMFSAIVQYIIIYSRDEGITREYLCNNPQKIIEQSREMKMNWQEIAKMAEVSRDRVYHWFKETFLRMHMRKITGEEKSIIRLEILRGIQSGEIARPEF